MLTSEFITAVRRQGKITSDTTDAEILATGDMEIQGSLVPLLRLSHQEYFVAETQVASVNGRVRLPTRSIMGAVRHVQLISGSIAQRLPQVTLESDYLGSGSSTPDSWYFDGGSIVLLPRGTDATVRLRYFVRPSKMIAETTTAKVTTITALATSGANTVLTLAGASTNDVNFDVVGSNGSHAVLVADYRSTNGTPEPVLTSSILSPIAVGDYVVSAGYSPVVPLPEELFAALVHQVAYVILRSLGYDNEAQAQQSLAQASLQQAQAILAPRSEGNPRKMRGGINKALGRFWGGWIR